MATPGVQIVSRSTPPSQGGNSPTGTWHVAAFAQRGPTDSPRLLLNLSDYDKAFGGREAYGQRDSVEAHFRNGGTAINFLRIVGPAATLATVALPGAAAAASLEADSLGAGASTLSVTVVVLADDRFTVGVYEGGLLLELSPPLDLPADAASWSASSPYIRLRATGAIVPVAVGPLALAAGDDDRAAVVDADRVAALAFIPKSDGPGQVSLPGATTAAAHAGLEAHAAANNRFAIKDAPDSGVEATLTAAADDCRALSTPAQQAHGFLVEGWHLIPGLIPGTTRLVPPSAIVSALMARQDAITLNPNEPAAGVAGIPSYSLGIVRASWTDEARGRLNAAGVNVFREMDGASRLYGYRTGVEEYGTEGAWLSASNVRLRMAIQSQADDIAEPFVFNQITPAKIAEYGGVLTGMLLEWYTRGALYGDSPEEALTVETGSTVNTAELIAARQLTAVMAVRMSEFAEVVYIEFVKVPVTEELS
jgi:hypothetical protein